MSEKKKEFNIYSSVVEQAHRECYEEICSSLRGNTLICTLGNCKAIELSDSEEEQDKIIFLMNRVSEFTEKLIDVAKRLFARFYESKEEFHKSLTCSIAYNKINLIDRNLLERTCDVRWWACELAFAEAVECANDFRVALENFYTYLALDHEGLSEYMQKPYMIVFEPSKLEEFEALLRSLFEDIGSYKQRDLQEKLAALIELRQIVYEKSQFACTRLEDITSSYTLYRDLVITDNKGFVIASANEHNRSFVLGHNVSEETWFEQACLTHDGTEYYVHDLQSSELEDQASLVYSTAVRQGGKTDAKMIGAMGVYFDFQGEGEMLVGDYMPIGEHGLIKEGWYSFITDHTGKIIATSSTENFPVGSKPKVSKSYLQLKAGERLANFMIYDGSPILHCAGKTDGHAEYPGLGWVSHVIVPEEDVYEKTDRSVGKGIDKDDLLNSKLNPETHGDVLTIREAHTVTEKNKVSIHHISVNGIIFASKLGKRAKSITPIFDAITKTGHFVTNQMENLLLEMACDQLKQNLEGMKILAKLAIDLIDRNLFERAADVRWWSTDHYIHKVVSEPSEENRAAALERLKTINESYTMYRDLLILDHQGDVLVSANDEHRSANSSKNLSGQEWFLESLETQAATDYRVSDVLASELEPNQDCSLIYCGGIRENGARRGLSIGVLAICFDWQVEGKAMLEACLPRSQSGNTVDGTVAFYTNQEGKVILSTSDELFKAGEQVDLPEKQLKLGAGETHSCLFHHQNKYYIIGSARTQGYREYKGLSWTAHVVRPF